MRDCIIIDQCEKTNVVFCVDQLNEEAICNLIRKRGSFGGKLKTIIKLIMEGNHNKEQFEKISKICKTIWEIRLSKGSINARIYVKEFVQDNKRYLILVLPLIKTDRKFDKENQKKLQAIDLYTYENIQEEKTEPTGIIRLIR